jgi:hypothetical protein
VAKIPQTLLGERGGSRYRLPDFSGFMSAFVVDNVDPMGLGRLLCYVPRLQPEHEAIPEVEFEEVEVEFKIVNGRFSNNKLELASIIANRSFIDVPELVVMRNCMWFYPSHLIQNGPDDRERVVSAAGVYQSVRIGTWITVYFVDGDPKKPYWLPATQNTSEVIQNKLANRDNSNADWDDPETKPNVHVLHEWYNGNLIEVNNNENTNSMQFAMYNKSEHLRNPRAGAPGEMASRSAGISYFRARPGARVAHRLKMEFNDKVNEVELISVGRKRLLFDEINDYVIMHSTDRHALVMSDRDQFVKVQTNKGHRILLDDLYKEVLVNTRNGYVAKLSDAEMLMEAYTVGKHRVSIDDLMQEMKIVSYQGHRITINDILQVVEVVTNNNYRITISALTGSIFVFTGGGQMVFMQDLLPSPIIGTLFPPDEFVLANRFISFLDREKPYTRPRERPIIPRPPSPGIIHARTLFGNIIELNDEPMIGVPIPMINVLTPGIVNVGAGIGVNVGAGAVLNMTSGVLTNNVSTHLHFSAAVVTGLYDSLGKPVYSRPTGPLPSALTAALASGTVVNSTLGLAAGFAGGAAGITLPVEGTGGIIPEVGSGKIPGVS